VQTTEFVERVQQHVEEPLAHDRARGAVEATLRVVGQTLSAREARRLAAQLPSELEAAVTSDLDGEAPPDWNAFRARVADLAGVAEREAETYADAALSVLREAVTPGEAIDVALELPPFVSELMAS
jgi:uncharacterized protein (DUF2267 family)